MQKSKGKMIIQNLKVGKILIFNFIIILVLSPFGKNRFSS